MSSVKFSRELNLYCITQKAYDGVFSGTKGKGVKETEPDSGRSGM